MLEKYFLFSLGLGKRKFGFGSGSCLVSMALPLFVMHLLDMYQSKLKINCHKNLCKKDEFLDIVAWFPIAKILLQRLMNLTIL